MRYMGACLEYYGNVAIQVAIVYRAMPYGFETFIPEKFVWVYRFMIGLTTYFKHLVRARYISKDEL